MEISGESEIVMITSAGCNALDYMLDQPSAIHCIDMNPRQNALLELKRAFFLNSSFEDLQQAFGKGRHEQFADLYQTQLRKSLPDSAQQYWDKNLNYFNGKGVRKSFYHYGSSGTFAWLASNYMRSRKKLYRKVCQMFEAPTLAEQRDLYYEVETRILNNMVEWMVNRHLTMCLVGVPRSQQELFMDKYERGALGFIQECLRKVFTELPLEDNYFWRLYLYGSYTDECAPNYILPENFQPLKDQMHKLHTHTTTISSFLKANPGQYSHFVLLDHQDWLAANDQSALEEEWQLILANSRPGTRILLRSAAHEVDFFPDFVKEAVVFEQEKTAKTHQLDRVGTYASVYLAIVQ
jgi:S-adenosylmethionine-diacylglycerol 3-amino-3-carboxypropyl transferase